MHPVIIALQMAVTLLQEANGKNVDLGTVNALVDQAKVVGQMAEANPAAFTEPTGFSQWSLIPPVNPDGVVVPTNTDAPIVPHIVTPAGVDLRQYSPADQWSVGQ